VATMKKRRNINLEAEQLEKIAKLSKKTGANPSAIIRLAIDEYLKRKGIK
jgi:predicted DNA-binding protein